MNYKLLFFACALNLFYYVSNPLGSPIIGGREDTHHTYKYHVSIQEKFNPNIPNSAVHRCGGAIIHDRYVLSAAHPFLLIYKGHFDYTTHPREDGIVVLSGTSETYGSGIITQVDKIFIPHDYTRDSPASGDISVLKLHDNLNVAHHENILEIVPIDEESHSLDFYVNENAFILGNGWDTLDNGDIVARVAYKRKSLEVRMIPRDACKPYDHVICAINLDTSHIGICYEGDSGSPIVFDNKVIGVVTGGPKDCHSNKPMVCTPTWTFANFIRDVKNEHVHPSKMYILEN